MVRFSQTLANVFMKMNDFRRRNRCATAKKPFLQGKSAISSRFFFSLEHFEDPRIPDSGILEFWNSRILEFRK